MRTTTGVTWISTDPQGTASVTVDASTQAYALRRQDPYGNARGTVTGSWPSSMDKGFLGGTKDGTGLTHIGVREYDPVIGRFASPDPELHPQDLRHLDTYGYGLNSPFANPDPSGASPDKTTEASGDTGWYRLGTPVFYDQRMDGYTEHYRVDFYVLCRRQGTECYGQFRTNQGSYVYYWVKAWELFRAIALGTRGVAFVMMTVVQHVRAGVGPYQLGAPIKDASACLSLAQPPPPTSNEKHCALFDLGCAFSSDWKTWWHDNGKWITGPIALVAFGACEVFSGGEATALCTTGLRAFATWAGVTGEVIDYFALSPQETGTVALAQMCAGAAWEYFGGKIFEHTRFSKVYGASDVASQFGVINNNPLDLYFIDTSTGQHYPMFSDIPPSFVPTPNTAAIGPTR